jgi:hypothetical protein
LTVVQTPPRPAAAGRFPESPLERTVRLLRQQGHACRVLGSPLYGDLLEAAAADLRDGGPTAAVLDGHLTDRGPSALALRMMGGVHALVLSGQAPDLAAFYPSAGGTADAGPGGRAAWAALRALLASRAGDLRGWLTGPPQTNEVGRGAALIGGLCHLMAAVPRPVRLFEIGSSAGLNLRADRFRIPGDAGRYGDPGALVVLPGAWLGHPPPEAAVQVTERSGGDVHPIDPATAGGRLRLMAYVWPDQDARMARLRSALDLAAQVPAELRQETAADTAGRIELAGGTWTVLWHSIVWQYLEPGQRAAVDRRRAALGAAADGSAGFAHLRLEPSRQGRYEVVLTTWPGGTERVLGTASPHGIPVTWAAQAAG